MGWFFVPSTPQKAAKIVDTAFKPLYEMAEPDFDWEKEPAELSLSSIKLNYGFFAKLMAGMLEESFYSIRDLYVLNIVEQRSAGVIIALRRYRNKTGQWPEKLDDIKPAAPSEILVDPINGGSFVYKLTDENFTLYSKGKNNIDEGGKPDRESGADDWPIWSPKSRKTKEEKVDAKQQ